MILRASLLFIIMASALAGMFLGNDKVIIAKEKPAEERRMPQLSGWPAASQIVAKQMMIEYGMPGEFTGSMLIWKNNGAWKKTILYKDEMQHNFPFHHPDILEQTIIYRVPEGKLDDLSKFDGSITANRTNGTLTVRCMNEHLNILALNYAYEIIKGKKSVSDARLGYYKKAAEILRGNIPEDGQHLIFSNDENAPDPR